MNPRLKPTGMTTFLTFVVYYDKTLYLRNRVLTQRVQELIDVIIVVIDGYADSHPAHGLCLSLFVGFVPFALRDNTLTERIIEFISRGF